ncbi:zinc finger and SCAN domain-containing protein 4-like isoform X2 [Panthera pardus]|uniref:Zinc finger and SCAN domain-containing protein 4-like isoform X2 n=1 Tax=Panthera pardus TaxID=9691 RepID=A0A9V1EZY0_PANPR|nr:zinc finger and SCAN domain-containing protein 4-like isoform X2 [Panthera pardus]
MALDLRISCQGEPSRNVPGSENLEHKPSQGPAIQGEEIYEFPSAQLSLFQNSNNSCAREELQNLYNLFHSWLQPEKHSKDEIISRLVLEQFMINGHCSDRSVLKEKWNTSGRNMEKFMENLTDDGMKPPGLLSAGTPTGENMGTRSCTPQDTSLAMGRGDENKENGGNIDQVNDGITSQGNEIPSLLIIQEEGCPRPEDDSVSLKNPVSSGRTGLAISGSQEGCPKGPPYQDILMELGPGFLSQPVKVTPEPVPTHQNEGISTCEGLQERSHEAPKPYRCEKCPKIFRYFSQLKAHQRRHNNERTFICAECNKGFFQASDLHVHQMTHAREKPFTCSTCEKSFSHKTNLQAHERIHTGEKPYACSLCRRSYRQSSTYHRHLRTHQKMAFKSAPSTPEASSAAAPM